MTVLLFLLVVGLPVTAVTLLRYFIGLYKVRAYVEVNYDKYEIVGIKWTVFGPVAPGQNSIKFRVVLKEPGNAEKMRELYAMTSFFGDVFIREE